MFQIILFVILLTVIIILASYQSLKVYRAYYTSQASLEVPGPERTEEKEGNIPDIAAAGSLHEYLVKLHKEYGPITSFWMGDNHVVSIASPELFKQHQHLFDRPPELFKLFEPMLGENSIQYANESDGKTRRNNYDKAFAYDKMKGYYFTLQEIADEMIDKWSNVPTGEHIALNTSISAYALKVVLVVFFGEHFQKEEDLLSFNKAYDVCWTEMEKSLAETLSPGSDRQKRFEKAKAELRGVIKSAVEQRRDDDETDDTDTDILIDMLLEHSPSENQLFADSVTYAVGGVHTSSNLMTWALYYLAQNQEVQQKVHQEIMSALQDDEGVDANNMGDLPYMMQVLQETLRCAVVAPWAARFEHKDSVLGGYHIPKDTPVIHALGVMLHDEKYWPRPDQFDPERFSPANVKRRPTLAFSPFGFAGKRICPGYKFAYAETCVLFAPLLRKFEIQMAGPQSIRGVHGLVTHPSEEIWITLRRR
ncbi:hypothetical protein ScPMuIL_015950 [Solemya velum]